MWLTSLSSWAWLNTRVRLNWLPKQLLRQVLNTLQIECVKQLEREHKLLQLNLPINPFKNAWPTSHSQICVFICQIGSLHWYVAIITKVEAVDGLIPVTFLFWIVLDQHTDSCCYPNSFLQVSRINL